MNMHTVVQMSAIKTRAKAVEFIYDYYTKVLKYKIRHSHTNLINLLASIVIKKARAL